MLFFIYLIKTVQLHAFRALCPTLIALPRVYHTFYRLLLFIVVKLIIVVDGKIICQ